MKLFSWIKNKFSGSKNDQSVVIDTLPTTTLICKCGSYDGRDCVLYEGGGSHAEVLCLSCMRKACNDGCIISL